MTTSRTNAQWDGFVKAVEEYFDQAIAEASAGFHRRSLQTNKSKMLTAADGCGEMLAILDKQTDDYPMKLTAAKFYLGWSPSVWTVRAKHPIYPFANKVKVATKGMIDSWFLACVEGKHGEALKSMRSPEWGRDPSSGHPYLIDKTTGLVICDGMVCGVSKKHVAAVAASDGDIRILRLTEALQLPWQNEAMREAWVREYRRYLIAMERQAATALTAFDKSVVRRATPDAKAKTKPRRP